MKVMVEASYVGNRTTRLGINRELSYTATFRCASTPSAILTRTSGTSGS